MQIKPDLKFIQKDKEQLISYMNFCAKHSRLKDLKHEEAIEFVSLLKYMQQMFLPKLIHCINELENKPIDNNVSKNLPKEKSKKKSKKSKE